MPGIHAIYTAVLTFVSHSLEVSGLLMLIEENSPFVHLKLLIVLRFINNRVLINSIAGESFAFNNCKMSASE